jgi:membrane-associated phospholipid phosphatase
MALLDVALQVVVVVAAAVAVAAVGLVGRKRLRVGHRTAWRNLRAVWPSAAFLAAVLAINGVVRDIGIDLSWLLGVNVTGTIYALEGTLVADLQSVATPALTAYFGGIYVFGYTFVLAFPVVLDLIASDPRPLRVLLVAYVANYGVGLCCYVLFVAYGPRNFMPELVAPLLYERWPQSQLLVSEVNTNTNVFPPLHTSLSATVAILAYRYRRIAPLWLPTATVLVASVAVATMYLGIHWATDVVAGVALAVVSVAAARRVAADGDDRSTPAAAHTRRGRRRDG